MGLVPMSTLSLSLLIGRPWCVANQTLVTSRSFPQKGETNEAGQHLLPKREDRKDPSFMEGLLHVT